MAKTTIPHSRLVIIGSGPAGYSAAIYASRAQLAPVLFAGPEVGGQLIYTSEIENYPGFPDGKPGPELMFAMREQAVKFGTLIRDEMITSVDFHQTPFKLSAGANILTADSVIIATGATAIMTGVAGESQLFGRGVSTCAVCDAAFYKNKTVYVVGGGDSAMEDALALAKFTDQVTIIHRRDTFRASKIMQERVLNHPHIKVRWNAVIREIKGGSKVDGVVVESLDQKGVRVLDQLPADGVFLAIGRSPVTKYLGDALALDKAGYLITRLSQSAAGLQLAGQHLDDKGLVEYPTMTSVEGVFGAGDVVDFRYRQAISAASMGCMAALDAEKYLEHKH